MKDSRPDLQWPKGCQDKNLTYTAPTRTDLHHYSRTDTMYRCREEEQLGLPAVTALRVAIRGGTRGSTCDERLSAAVLALTALKPSPAS